MKTSKQRRQIAWEAARLIGQQPQLTYSAACQQAVRSLFPLGVPQRDLPSAEEVTDQLRQQAGAELRASWDNRFARYAQLLEPLARVKQDPQNHPEGDALYHSLQVFQLVQESYDYDEELLTAALLHDVGKVLDRRNPIAAALEALSELVTQRTSWFVENLSLAKAYLAGELGQRARKRLEAAEDFDELICLARSDRAGRVRGAGAPDLDSALAQICALHGEAES